VSLERKDVRAKLDPAHHKALTVLCEVDGVDISEFIERALVRVIEHRVSAAKYIAERAPVFLGFPGRNRETNA
jgi:hypothetical protein